MDPLNTLNQHIVQFSTHAQQAKVKAKQEGYGAIRTVFSVLKGRIQDFRSNGSKLDVIKVKVWEGEREVGLLEAIQEDLEELTEDLYFDAEAVKTSLFSLAALANGEHDASGMKATRMQRDMAAQICRSQAYSRLLVKLNKELAEPSTFEAVAAAGNEVPTVVSKIVVEALSRQLVVGVAKALGYDNRVIQQAIDGPVTEVPKRGVEVSKLQTLTEIRQAILRGVEEPDGDRVEKAFASLRQMIDSLKDSEIRAKLQRDVEILNKQLESLWRDDKSEKYPYPGGIGVKWRYHRNGFSLYDLNNT